MGKRLEEKMVKYRDLIGVRIKDNNDPFVEIDKRIIPYGYLSGMNDMKKYLKNKIVVRKTVYEKLKKAQKDLVNKNPELSLFITYGYRNMEIQTEKFLINFQEITKSRFFPNPIDLYEEVHRFIAVPTVAGHPTGGAVDIVIINTDNNEIIDFGSTIYDFSNKKNYVFDITVSKTAKQNRQLLRKVMLRQGFAPFDGEWWHFSYGDKEWAFYKKQPKAIYNQVRLSEVEKIFINTV